MYEKIIALCFNGVSIVDFNLLIKNGIDVKIVHEFPEIDSVIQSFNPDAILIQLIEINKQIIEELNAVYKRNNLHIPWLCLVMKNNPDAETLARVNKVFYYGIGIKDIEQIVAATKDAARHGVFMKSEKNYIQKFSTNT